MDVSNYLSKYEGHEWFRKTQGEDKRFLCVWLLYYAGNFADAKISIMQVLLYEIIFSVYSAAVT